MRDRISGQPTGGSFAGMNRYLKFVFLALFISAFGFIREAFAAESGSATTRSVSIVFPVMVDAFTDFKNEFEDELRADKVKISTFSAEGAPDRFAPSIKAGLFEKPDVLVTVGTQITNAAFATQFAADLPKVIASSISAPEKAESLVRIGLEPPRKLPVAIVSDSPKNNVYQLGVEAIESVLGPGKKKIGVLFNEGEINSKNTAAQLTNPLAKAGHQIIPATLTGPADLERACTALIVKGVDSPYRIVRS